MAVSFGFYNSIDGDRKYTAEQMGSLFDGIINDGIYQSVGKQFAVTPGTGMQVKVDTGRAWFNGTWTLNDAPILLTVHPADLLVDRIDAVVIEVNLADDVRANSIKILRGVKSNDPSRPTLNRSGTLWQYPLAWIYIKSSSTSITTSNIINARGASPTPWVTGPLKTMDATTLYTSWANSWNTWFSGVQTSQKTTIQNFIDEKNLDFNSWFKTIKSQLDGDQAAALAARVIELEKKLEGQSDTGTITYDDLMDSSGNTILDSGNSSIQGKLIYILA